MADILVILIILLSTYFGAKKGFSLTVVSFMQWFVCLILGVFFCGKVRGILEDYTELDNNILGALKAQMQETAQGSSAYEALPDLFGGWLGETAETVGADLAASITGVLMTIVAFLTIVFGIKLICFLFSRMFSKKHRGGAIGFFDGFLGFLFGAVRGFLLVFLFFTILVPVLSLFLPDVSAVILTSLDESRLSHYLYEENILLILMRDLAG